MRRPNADREDGGSLSLSPWRDVFISLSNQLLSLCFQHSLLLVGIVFKGEMVVSIGIIIFVTLNHKKTKK